MIKSVADKIEGLYSVWFLGELGNNWSDMCAEELRDYGQIQGVMRQEDFYTNKISRADSRIFVIISGCNALCGRSKSCGAIKDRNAK